MPRISLRSRKLDQCDSRLGQAIFKLRQKLAWTQRRLADELEVDPGTVSRWETAAIPVPRVAVLAMASLTPDDETRDQFLLDIEKSADKIPGSSEQKAKVSNLETSTDLMQKPS